jgi:dihydroxyacetone kinase
MNSRFFMLVFVIMSGFAHAGCEEQKPIRKMICHATSTSGDLMLAEIKGGGSEATVAGMNGKKKLDDDVAKAIAEAKGKQDLVKAIKAFYLAAGKYFDNPNGAMGRAYKADYNSADDALHLEAKLAGIPDAK